MPEASDVGGGAAHVDDQRLVALRDEGGAAHRVGRPRGEAVDGIRLCHPRHHHGAVVLGQVEWRRDAARAQRLGECPRGPSGQLDEAGVEEGGIFALEQADAPEPVGEGDRHVGALLVENRAGLFLAVSVQGREDGGDADRADPGGTDPPRGLTHAPGVERNERSAVELVPAVAEVNVLAERGA